MTKIRLEIDEVKIYRPRKRWHLYFVVVAEHPEDNDKMIISTLPQQPFLLTHRHDNVYHFDVPDQPGSEGLFVLSREMPKDRELNVQFYLRHSRKATRDLGQILEDLKTGIAGDALGIVSDIVGTAGTPWLVIAKKSLSMVGKILEKIPDKDFGFLSAFERFGPEFEAQTDIDREKQFTGDASMVYSWTVDDD
ncbi:hypothetical protein LA303_07405 [Candidatus Sulfidibacterium hydrothermale]|uniref:hypothetical protein n=1 Tax=Candidatus Sulfidibacterium hydrothermale TaxID=2875962 RepID=UPI001F0A38BF|nr:hypothetical protein [Candidatus Sulfidibacterium hydrothermale]UBM61250.1 hypothetical protein LA303_07405 [Candidatus Sulfidibacterium hydrothermale]